LTIKVQPIDYDAGDPRKLRPVYQLSKF